MARKGVTGKQFGARPYQSPKQREIARSPTRTGVPTQVGSKDSLAAAEATPYYGPAYKEAVMSGKSHEQAIAYLESKAPQATKSSSSTQNFTQSTVQTAQGGVSTAFPERYKTTVQTLNVPFKAKVGPSYSITGTAGKGSFSQAPYAPGYTPTKSSGITGLMVSTPQKKTKVERIKEYWIGGPKEAYRKWSGKPFEERGSDVVYGLMSGPGLPLFKALEFSTAETRNELAREKLAAETKYQKDIIEKDIGKDVKSYEQKLTSFGGKWESKTKTGEFTGTEQEFKQYTKEFEQLSKEGDVVKEKVKTYDYSKVPGKASKERLKSEIKELKPSSWGEASKLMMPFGLGISEKIITSKPGQRFLTSKATLAAGSAAITKASISGAKEYVTKPERLIVEPKIKEMQVGGVKDVEFPVTYKQDGIKITEIVKTKGAEVGFKGEVTTTPSFKLFGKTIKVKPMAVTEPIAGKVDITGPLKPGTIAFTDTKSGILKEGSITFKQGKVSVVGRDVDAFATTRGYVKIPKE